MEDFYDLLGVSEDAAPADVKRAWRGKAREYHPDVNDDARAGVQFKTLRAAYEVLSDETKRAAYDRMGHERYVAERLDGLPTAGMERRDDGADAGGRWSRRTAAAGADSGGRSASAQSTESASASGGASNRTRSSGASAGARTTGRTRTRGTDRSRADSTRRSRSSADAARTGAARAANRSTRAGSASAAGPGAESVTSSSSASRSAASASAAPRSLWYAWVASLFAGVAYLGGLAVYLRVNAAALSSFAAAAEASPASALLADAGLVAPGAFALGAVGSAPGPALAFPLGSAFLAAVFVAFAVRFRHGTAGLSLYLYPLGALAPLASLALGPVVAAPAAGLTLALVVAAPVLTVTAFLADVGRTLVASN
ncbi:DnaJ domain-containing protein [Halogeometricum luteum]|uniref:DnaJ domain-containing protein n=1 Tax=Halogeometricum luteum TaxID=2950537 RepID=A0ABU2FXN3_9EURY|nr:DnaJ domain-containing protein [Halogeometricum sp. S3BR5-2]MDS0293298.1 DnaJ domain-containing protein [Halogeometricum sp. S3BR5-2]